jgi:CDP-diacylglycerol--serine O-phosphatidyltransferase
MRFRLRFVWRGLILSCLTRLIMPRAILPAFPAPASGFLVLLPIVIDLQFNLEIARDPNWVSAWLVLVGAGAVSALPTFAGKRVKLPVESVLPVLAGIGLLGAAVVTEPWFTYMAVVVIYSA